MNQQQPKLEGTFVLEGLIEGTLPDESLVKALRSWEVQVKTAQLPLVVQIDGSHFNVLPDPQAVKVNRLNGSLRDILVPLLEQMLDIIPAGWRPGVTSTLRSREFLPNEEEQTLYVFDQAGMVLVEQRRVETQTIKPAPPLSRREMIIIGGTALVIISIILVILFVFFDVKSLFRDARDSFVPYCSDEIVLKAERFEEWMTPESREVERNRELVLEFKPTEQWPKTWEDLNALYAKAGTLKEKLAIEALAREEIAYRLFDRDDKLIASGKAMPMLKRDGGEKADESGLFQESEKDGVIVLRIPLSDRRRVVRVDILP